MLLLTKSFITDDNMAQSYLCLRLILLLRLPCTQCVTLDPAVDSNAKWIRLVHY